ncbi:MAG: YigZ family protein [Candidatus Thermoplasmatota archaeon]|nr:YigZ family protein [Candidatus Thermoplasmatota archaeon]
MKETARGMLNVQRSKFYVHLYELEEGEGSEVAKEVAKEHRRMYKKAVHHCWAMRNQGEEQGKDDGEVGHPGKVLLEVLRKHGLEHHLVVVSRIFGGTKLGVGGVSRAFREAAESVLEGME